MARSWRDLSWPEFQGLDPETTIAVLPVAAIEQHGPHLPVGVDDYINEGVLTAAMALMPDSVLVLPTTHVGKSNEHLQFPGTLTFSHETLIRMIETKLFPLGDDTAFLPGHGPMGTIGVERRTNPFL